MNYEKMKSLEKLRRKVSKALKKRFRLKREKRCTLDEPMVQHWLGLDLKQAYSVPKKLNELNLKGELYRFASVIFELAGRFGNGFNFSDKQFIEEFQFNKSRIPTYKTELEKLGLIEVILAKKCGKLRWPKSTYLIYEFWNT